MKRALLAMAMVGCGPVGTPAPEEPVEATARRAIAAALRAALAEACRATLPPLDAHPLARIAWGMACSPATLPPPVPHAAP